MAARCETARRSWEPARVPFVSNYGRLCASVAAVARNVDEISIGSDERAGIRFLPDKPESRFARATKLRARGARYRRLAECVFDPSIVRTAQACALELEAEAESIEQMETDGAARTEA